MASTRDRIIVATNELFRRHGYNGTTLSQISAASDATIGSIYHFFPGGKEALGVAVVDTTGVVYRELFESITAEADSAARAYIDFFTGAAEVLEQSGFIDPCPIGTVAREVANTSEPLRHAAERAFDDMDHGRSNPPDHRRHRARHRHRTGRPLRRHGGRHVRTEQNPTRHHFTPGRWTPSRHARRTGHHRLGPNPRLAGTVRRARGYPDCGTGRTGAFIRCDSDSSRSACQGACQSDRLLEV